MAAERGGVEGVTEVEGRPRLPAQPEVVVELLRAACEDALTTPELVARVVARTGVERARAEGLAGWLPLSHVARWTSDGRLRLHPETSVFDLAIRYAAWAGAQHAAGDQVDALTAYTTRVIELARSAVDPVGAHEPAWTHDEAQDAGPVGADPLTERLARVVGALDRAFAERSDQVRAALLAVLSGGHALLLGPPGTGKSMLARALCAAFEDARYFEYLLSRFTHPDELFGPVSLSALKAEDYRRLTEGFLPGAHIAFLDEIFKANSAILNSLLTLVNERVFHHGRHRDPVPLLGLIGASNELPDPEGGLAALYDRFLVRMSVPPVADAAAFLAVATGGLPGVDLAPEDRITADDLRLLRARADAVAVPRAVEQALVELWREATTRAWGVSDRRWRQAVGMLRVAAAAEGRGEVEELDLLLLEPVLAPDPERAAEVREVLLARVAPRSLPSHDLRAQWTLLQLDRVAPRGREGLDAVRPTDFDGRVALRRRQADRFILRAEDAVMRLAADRDRLERRGAGRLWVTRAPPRLLAAHIEAGRDLARILDAAEQYRACLVDLNTLAVGLLQSLPEPVRREIVPGVAARLRLAELDRMIGVTLAGERIEPPRPDEGRTDGSALSRAGRGFDYLAQAWQQAGEINVSVAELVAFARGEISPEHLADRVPAWQRRSVLGAIQRVAERLGQSGIPKPGRLPDPVGR